MRSHGEFAAHAARAGGARRAEGQLTPGISQHVFQQYLLSDANGALAPERVALRHERMREPLAQYWIFSSHNTYLTGNQLTSD